MPTKTWEINRTTFKVSHFVSWQRASNLILTPKFQRRAVWKPGAKSLLIDTVVRGLPMPIIFLREQATDLRTIEPKQEVVDGQQRIRTLLSFIDPSLLPDFDPARDQFTVKKTHNADLAGKRFPDLSDSTRQRILDYQFSVHVLPAYVDDREVIQLFARMNSTGVQLNPQELRNAAWYGEFKTSVYALATEQLERWRAWRIFDEQEIARMDEAELVSEFAQLALKGIVGKSQKALDSLYEEKDELYPERAEVERRFHHLMDVIDDQFGNEMPSLPFSRKTLFFSLYAFAYDAAFGLGSRLHRLPPKPIPDARAKWVKTAGDRIQHGTAPKTVLEAVARRTTHPSSRSRIVKYLASRS
jgi:hypothetical protein